MNLYIYPICFIRSKNISRLRAPSEVLTFSVAVLQSVTVRGLLLVALVRTPAGETNPRVRREKQTPASVERN